MYKLSRTLLLCAAALVTMAGCASGPSYREMATSIPTLAPQNGRLYFFRSGSVIGAAVQPDIKLNGETVGNRSPAASSMSTSRQVATRYRRRPKRKRR